MDSRPHQPTTTTLGLTAPDRSLSLPRGWKPLNLAGHLLIQRGVPSKPFPLPWFCGSVREV